MDPTRLGQLALAYGMLEPADLERCLRIQERSSPPRYLGEILVGEQLIDGLALRRLLSAQRKELETIDPDAGMRFERTAIAERLESGELRDYLEVLSELNAQELHLAAGSRPMVRLNGSLISIRPRELTAEETWNVLGASLGDPAWERFRKTHSLQFVHRERGLGRFRAGYFFQSKGPSAVFCAIPTTLPPLEELGLPEVVAEVSTLGSGIVLVAGTRGSGRSTTVATLVEQINVAARRHIVCLDDSVEFVHQSKLSLVTQRQIGRDAPNWQGALRAALREDPDVLVLGDLASPARLHAALHAAASGVLVIAALRSQSAPQALLSLVKGVASEKRDHVCQALSLHLRFVFAQQLVPGQGGRSLELAVEVLRNTNAVATALREGRFQQLARLIETSAKEGMQSMDDALDALVRSEKITPGDALARASDRERLFGQIRDRGETS